MVLCNPGISYAAEILEWNDNEPRDYGDVKRHWWEEGGGVVVEMTNALPLHSFLFYVIHNTNFAWFFFFNLSYAAAPIIWHLSAGVKDGPVRNASANVNSAEKRKKSFFFFFFSGSILQQ